MMRFVVFGILVSQGLLSSTLAGAAPSSICAFYLSHAREIPKSELESLAKTYPQMDSLEQKRIEERVIAGTMREILIMAKRRARVNLSIQLEDLVQSGLKEVSSALRKYDVNKGKFVSYLMTWVNAGMMKTIERHYSLNGVLSNTELGRPYFYRRARVLGHLESRGEAVTPQNIADTYNQLFPQGPIATPTRVEAEERFYARRFSVSLDQPDALGKPIGESFSSDSLRDPEQDFALKEELTALNQLLEEFLNQLSQPLEKRIFSERVLPILAGESENFPTLHFLGVEFGLSRERVRQIQARILRQFNSFLKKKGLKGLPNYSASGF